MRVGHPFCSADRSPVTRRSVGVWTGAGAARSDGLDIQTCGWLAWESKGCLSSLIGVRKNANGRLTEYKSYRLVGLIRPNNIRLH
jgi:hypothetical protein